EPTSVTRTWTSATSAFAVLTLFFSSSGLALGRVAAKPTAARAGRAATQYHLRRRRPLGLAMLLPLSTPPGRARVGLSRYPVVIRITFRRGSRNVKRRQAPVSRAFAARAEASAC